MNSPEEEPKADDEFLERVRNYWSKKSGKELSLEDTRKALERTVGLISQFRVPGKPPIKQDPEYTGSKLTIEEHIELFKELFKPKVTKEGANMTFSLEWPDKAKDERDPKRLGAIFVDRLIVYFEEYFFRTLTREVARDMLDYLSDM